MSPFETKRDNGLQEGPRRGRGATPNQEKGGGAERPGSSRCYGTGRGAQIVQRTPRKTAFFLTFELKDGKPAREREMLNIPGLGELVEGSA